MQIEAVLLDMDMTLSRTQNAFDQVWGQARLYLADTLSLPLVQVERQFSQFLGEGRRVGNVEPVALIGHTMMGFRLAYPNVANWVWENMAEIMWQVYAQPVEAYPDVVPALETLQQMGYMMGVVTHSKRSWTDFKSTCIGVGPYLKYGRCFSARTDLAKDMHTWQEGAGFYKFIPETTAVVGDNLEDDAHAALLAGFGSVCWLNRIGDSRGFIKDGTPQAGVNVVHGLGEFVILLAERGGFEPPVNLRPHTISNRTD